MKRGELIEKVLDALQDGAELTGDLLSVFLAGRAESYRRARRLSGGFSSGSRFSGRWSDEYRRVQQFHSLLTKLQTEGLVVKRKKDKGQSSWFLTGKGRNKLLVLQKRRVFAPGAVSYVGRPGSSVKVVIFDIPEKERHKRDWLRAALLVLGFSLCQRSVWVGKRALPADFLRDLESRRMLSYVTIFEVTRGGSLREVV